MTEFKKLKRTHFYWLSMIAVGMVPFLLFFFYWIGGITFGPADLNKINLFLLSSVHNKITFPLIVIVLAKIDGGLKGLKTGGYLPVSKDGFIGSKLLFSFLWMVALIVVSLLWNVGLGSLIFDPQAVLDVFMTSLSDYGLVLILGFSFQCLSLLIYYMIDSYIYTLFILMASLLISYGLQLYRDFPFLNSYLTKYFVLKPNLDIQLYFHLMSMFVVIIMSLIGLHTIIRRLDRNQ